MRGFNTPLSYFERPLWRWLSSVWQDLESSRRHASWNVCEELSELTEVRKSTLKQGGTIPWAWVLGYIKRRKLEVKTLMSLFPDQGGNGTSCLRLLVPWIPSQDGLYPRTKNQNKPYFPGVAVAWVFYHSNRYRNGDNLLNSMTRFQS